MSINPSIALPAAAVYCGAGSLASCAVFDKLSHVTEYILNKTFGDDFRKTADGRVVVSMNQDYYHLQNVILGSLVAAVAFKAVQILALAGVPSLITLSLTVGGVAGPILFALTNIITREMGGHHGRAVALSNVEVMKLAINKDSLRRADDYKRVYFNFGSEPIRLL